MRLLLVEDDHMIGRAVRHGLGDAGFAVDWVMDGNAAERALANGVYDLALLDLGLPGQDGMAVLKLLRRCGNAVPVLIVSAHDAVADRIAGLNAGADDYVLKPFDLDELIARVRALLRRRAGGGSPLLECGALTLDPVRKEVRLEGELVSLSAREFTAPGRCNSTSSNAIARTDKRRRPTRGGAKRVARQHCTRPAPD